MRTTFPKPGEIDRAAFTRDMGLPRAKTNYIILFTPRAGSTWLTDVASKTGKLGRPDESFNPRHLSKMARAMNACNLPDYVEMLARRRATNGVAGFEITHHQIRAVFRTHDRFRAHFPDSTIFWLTRQDIVAQAVSLYKMTTTRVSHTSKLSAAEIAARELQFVYSADRIAHWVDHILLAELRTEKLIQEAGWTPMRLWYEWNVHVGPQVMLNRMAEFMGLAPVLRGEQMPSDHRKIATGKNAEFAERFIRERPDFVANVSEKRGPMLEKLRPYRQQLNTLPRAA